MMKKTTEFTVQATIIKDDRYTSEGYTAILQGGAFQGKFTSGDLGFAFTHALEDLMAKVAEGTFGG